MLLSFGLKYSKSREVSEEIVEDTFLWIWNHRDTIKNVNSLKPVLFIRMKSYLINAYRATVNAPIFNDFIEYAAEISGSEASEKIEYEEFVARLRTAIGTLPKTQRNVVWLSKMDMLSVKEISQKMNLTEQTVRNQLSLGLKRLRVELGLPATLIGMIFLEYFS
jgi:RNA polymerase sigma-70 factor (ECF subfamily)